MENASKALIIAGAILLSILIIGLAVYIYRQASGVMGDTGMSQLAIEQFNEKFEAYEGKQSGSDVRQLLKLIMSNNYTYQDDESMQVTVNGGRTVIGNTSLSGRKIEFSDTYEVSFEEGRLSNGLIHDISIELITE